jgi:hypothetical protein
LALLLLTCPYQFGTDVPVTGSAVMLIALGEFAAVFGFVGAVLLIALAFSS